MRLQTSDPAGGPDCASRHFREQLQEMTAASHALARALSGQEKALRYLAVIDRGLFRQRYLLRRVELERRLNSEDEIRLLPAPVDLVELCAGLIHQTDALTRALDIRARLRTDLAALPTMADRACFEDMLLALIANSVAALQGAGHPGEITLELEQREERAVLTLTDNGGGMRPETLAGLFPPPEEGEDPDLLTHGLPLARQIASLHGGSLVVENRPEQGVRLALSFPLLEKAAGALHSPAPVHEDGRILAALSGCLPPEAFLPEGVRL